MFGFSDRRTRRNISWAFWSPLDRDGSSCSILNNFFGEPGSGLSLCTNKCLFLGSLAALSGTRPLAGIRETSRRTTILSTPLSMFEKSDCRWYRNGQPHVMLRHAFPSRPSRALFTMTVQNKFPGG